MRFRDGFAIEEETMDDWTSGFYGLSRLDTGIRERLNREGRAVHVAAGTTIFAPGKAPDSLYFLISGTVKVFQTSESGREIVLYRVEAGQSCVMTSACLLAHQSQAAEGIAETDVKAIALPRAAFDALIAEVPAFRDFVFMAYAMRMNDLFRVIDDVAFGRIDVRLALRLMALAADDDTIHVTHQGLATELGTAREVISRQLNDFQKRGLVEQGRGVITLRDRIALERLAETVI